jgi:hypothetical protein
MPDRTRAWIWTGRAVAAAAAARLTWYLSAAGLGRSERLAAPVGLVIALAALLAPYLLSVYQPPLAPPVLPVGPPPTGPGAVVITADYASVAAQDIGEVTMHPPRPGAPDDEASQ